MNYKLYLTLTFLLLMSQLHADSRRYVWTYEYQTLPRGEAEMESYTGFSLFDTDSGRQASTRLQYEYEIGMNDRFDVGIYQTFTQLPGQALQYDGFKLRFRFRFGEKGHWLVDPLLYLEYKNNGAFNQSVLESKLILAKDFDRINLSLNPVLEIKFGESETEIEFEYSAGTSYRLHPLISLGLEAKGNA